MCARLALPATSTLVDHAADHLVCLDEPEMTREEARNLWADLLRSHEAAPGAALPEPKAIFVSPEEVEKILSERARWSLRHLRLESVEEEEGGGTLQIAASGAPADRGRVSPFLEE